MKRTYLLLLACLSTVMFTNINAKAYTSETDSPYVRKIVLSETDQYVDLRTGNPIHLQWNATSNTYTRADDVPLEIYYSTNSLDTFYGAEAIPVNNALIRGVDGTYTVDPLRLKQNGDGYKMKTADGEWKVKDNENELKMKDGDTKVKENANEYKAKDGDAKVKENDNELKMKAGDNKIKGNGKEQKYKTDDGTKVKSNDKETKIKTDDSKTTIDHRSGEIKTKKK